MSKFKNSDYVALTSDTVHDAFYMDTSYRGKISALRQIAEVVVRKILDTPPAQEITLGSKYVKENVMILPEHTYVERALNAIKRVGNPASHTQHVKQFTENDFNQVMDALLDLQAYLLIRFFQANEFGSDSRIVSEFSLLPPIIRFKTLYFLYAKHPRNELIIDKLALAAVKAYPTDEVRKWFRQEEKAIRQVNSRLYDYSMEAINTMGALLDSKGTLYSDYEEALAAYKKNGGLNADDNPRYAEFNDIMEFLYLGRVERQHFLGEERVPMQVLRVFCRNGKIKRRKY